MNGFTGSGDNTVRADTEIFNTITIGVPNGSPHTDMPRFYAENTPRFYAENTNAITAIEWLVQFIAAFTGKSNFETRERCLAIGSTQQIT